MAVRDKGKSPFHPSQPVPIELFVGRQDQIDRMLTRGAAQVKAGKPVSFFVQGEYGIGKSSIANYLQNAAEQQFQLLRINANLGGAETIEELAVRILEATVQSGARNPSLSGRFKSWLGKYIGKQQLFGFSVNLEALREDAPQLSTPSQMLGFFRETLDRMKGEVAGISLVLDELNGIVNTPKFSHFIKGLIEENAFTDRPVPLLLILCGVEERRRTMIRHHPPVDRIFDIVEIEKMSQPEMEEFFSRSFASADMKVKPEAMRLLTLYSAGLPKVMHVIGDEAYFADTDNVVDVKDANAAVMGAADEIGRKFVDQQVYRALRSHDYHSILKKIASHGPTTMSFTKKQAAEGLNDSERKKLNNFLQRMKKLNVIRSGDTAGEYVFNVKMVRLYIWLNSLNEK